MIETTYTLYTEEGTVSLSSGPGGIYVTAKRAEEGLEPTEVSVQISADKLRELIDAANRLLEEEDGSLPSSSS